MRVVLGKSVEGRPIEALVLGRAGGRTTLILGGFHGDEPKGVSIAYRLVELLESGGYVVADLASIIVLVVNPDGFERRKRRNVNGVDINRNFPTRNWQRTVQRSRMFGGNAAGSEPETRAVIEAVNRYHPTRIISVHSINGGRHCNNFDGPAEAIASMMQRFNGYPVESSIGYPTPGSFGTWAGVERNIPTITLELPSGHSTKRCWEENRDALLAAVLA